MNGERATELLKDFIKPDGSLVCHKADITPDELEAIAWWMRNHGALGNARHAPSFFTTTLKQTHIPEEGNNP